MISLITTHVERVYHFQIAFVKSSRLSLQGDMEGTEGKGTFEGPKGKKGYVRDGGRTWECRGLFDCLATWYW